MGRVLLAVAALAVLPAAAAAQNDQFVLVDTLYVHTTETKGFSYFGIPPDVPENWKKPVNFTDGRIHFRLEVLSKPSNVPVNYQLCIFQDRRAASKHA